MSEIHLLLPPKEKFCAEGAGAFALNVAQSTRYSRWRDAITVFGTPVSAPFAGIAFQPIRPARPWLQGRNIGLAERYAACVRGKPPCLIETFNRPAMALRIAQRLPDVPVTVYLGNDPRTMRGAMSAGERISLAERCARVYVVSDFIRRCYMEGLPATLESKIEIAHTGAILPLRPAPKEKRIVFVGRMLPVKGVLELAQALARVLPRHPGWRADLIGAQHFGASRRLSSYERGVRAAVQSCDRIDVHGFLPNDLVMTHLRRASIAVVPSVWDDPFPRTAVEALSQGCALVCSDRGGLPEIGRERAVMLSEITADTLAAALDRLIGDEAFRLALQTRARAEFPFDIETTTRRLDDLRAAIVAPSREMLPAA